MAEKDAFCLLLWVAQGGPVIDGQPSFSANRTASGRCDDPCDCYRCPLMQQELAQHPAGMTHWVCPACLSDVLRRAKEKGVSVNLAGHYTEGQCQYVGCTRPPRTEFDEQLEVIVERPRGFSRFLQLVIGDINT